MLTSIFSYALIVIYMKESINYYYNFNIAEVENWGDNYRFYYLNQLFYFVPFKRAEAELEDIINVSKELKGKNIEVHDIITNRFGRVITNVQNMNYILLRTIGDISQEFQINDIIRMNNMLILNESKSKLYRNSWASLWSAKLDYFEYQVSELGKDKPLVLDSFSYYLGLGENAISYLNEITSKYTPGKDDRICLSHKRIDVPNYKLNYLNPLSFIMDYEVRDLASYIKSAFFKGEDALSYLRELLRIKRFTIYSYGLFYARLLYPTYYFDVYEGIMNGKKDEDDLIPIIDKVEAYEEFLKNAYYEISKYAPIDRIEWLLIDK